MRSLAPRLGRSVRKYRLAARLSQEQLADRARLHRTYISLLERGLRNPSVDTLRQIAGALGVASAELLTDAEGHGP